MRISLRCLNPASPTIASVGLRMLLGVGAWVLGASAATGGSLFAVHRLGEDLLAQQSVQVSISTVKAQLANERLETPASAPSSSPSPTTHPHRGARSVKPVPTSAAVLLVSPDGSADAVCQAGNAYLVYWTPQQGFEADPVYRGPAAMAQVTFHDARGNGVVLHVTCRNGAPAKFVTAITHRDE